MELIATKSIACVVYNMCQFGSIVCPSCGCSDLVIVLDSKINNVCVLVTYYRYVQDRQS